MKCMLAIPGYKVSEKIHDGVRTIVYRAYQEATQTPVVIKILNTEYPQFRDLILFRNQYAIARNLDHPNIIKCYSLENYRNSYALILEDFGGISLSEYTNSVPLNKSEFFSIAISITLALESNGTKKSRNACDLSSLQLFAPIRAGVSSNNLGIKLIK